MAEFPTPDEEALARAQYDDGAGEIPFPQFSAWVLRLAPRDRRYALRTLEFVAGAVGDLAGEMPEEFARIFREMGRNPITVREEEMLKAALGSLQKAVVDMAQVARG